MKETLIGHYARTLAHLRPSQVFWRAAYRIERAMPGFLVSLLYRPPSQPLAIAEPLSLAPPPVNRYGETEIKEMALGLFRFLQEERVLGRHALNWHLGLVRHGRLWVANLHYHEWAYRLAEASLSGERFAPEALRLFHVYVSDWIQQCSLSASGARHLAWNPYVIATRIGWWARALWLLRSNTQRVEPDLERAMLRSLYVQAQYLADHLEWDTRGNHLLRDVAGLAWVGRFLTCRHQPCWLDCARRVIRTELSHQFLPDGGHYERSPMYHAAALYDIIHTLILLSDAEISEAACAIIGKGLEWLDWMRHPDGEICLFNDAALSLAPSSGYLRKIAPIAGCHASNTSPAGLRWFQDTGMAVWHGRPWTIFFDAGEVGPKEQPGHAHADTLSIECSLNGHRLFVDTGVFHYDPSSERDYARSTSAHNTVTVDGENSSEVWGLFRVGRMARIISAAAHEIRGGFVAEGEHDGYRFLFGSPRHARRLELQSDHTLTVTDRITGRGQHVLEGGLLLAPGWEAKATTQGWLIQGPGGRLRITVNGKPTPQLEMQARPYFPTFGVRRETARLAWRSRAELPVEFIITITP